jgi:pyruvate formate lyase activating enzyme
MAATALEQVLSRLAREGELYERLPADRVHCYACGHRCLIPPGQRGVCKVRWNEDGRLMVPAGYVAALQLDPVEKKPFFHAFPGSRALSFGMLGCDYHCAYCTAPGTLVATSKGLISMKQLWDSAEPYAEGEPSVRVASDLEVYTHTGRARRVHRLFRHRYIGPMLTLVPAYLLPLQVTPDHGMLATTAPDLEQGVTGPRFIRAGDLGRHHYLAIPKRFEFSYPSVLDTRALLKPLAKRIRHNRLLDAAFLRRVVRLSERGLTSREIGRRVGKSASHVRHLRGKLRRGVWTLGRLYSKQALVHLESGRVRFSKEHRPGIPAHLPLDERLAALLGYFAAEGSVCHSSTRVHSGVVVFSLGHHEAELAERIRRLLAAVFGVKPQLVRRDTTLCVEVGKASVALVFEALCGTGAQSKHLPADLFHAPRTVVEAFLNAYVEGNGHRQSGGMVAVSTVSKRLALEVTWLVLKTGRFASLRRTRQAKDRKLLGRIVRNAPYLFTVYWSDKPHQRLWLREDHDHFYVPLRSVRTRPAAGFVYNLEVEADHSFLAQFVATHNCQNALTSQALRDPAMGVPPEEVTPEEIVSVALQRGARILTSTYNEPLITSEWAVEIFRAGRARGLVGSYVSNGNATVEVLEYLRPFVDLYKVDLKGFDDRHYRKLGGVLQTVLDTIGRLHAMGFWLEIVTLIVPRFNDSEAELKDIARFLVSVSPDIPWHVTAFHPDYKMTDRNGTTARTLLRAAEIGREEGLNFVYAGNLPGRVGTFENTDCPGCRMLLIERAGYTILEDHLTPSRGVCPGCETRIPGVWS